MVMLAAMARPVKGHVSKNVRSSGFQPMASANFATIP
jgi:hypothetical protein